ncbi:MAG: PEP-dependent dihydroxyacetone kinase, ADP-binding subunit DhaL [Chroococcidiopsis cubana SAG 39.79]|uniref:Dihydroxyacetone kinase subunit DhaL n=1 Tax=Chroococcidiopsis cubana SAG 39.79 TaxID=388085 RepID=A0AB37UCU0_9CYAN|nr:dihydroxyacetone kinase subunit DhaL [Chroococcidiopsis cubana]MDZ4872701.1 PEP-dependent dihydroxyacetone kinase, ADP-binding subunit DhaL [Chroococcidiopsis cubana SAG 39.79]PSB44685.1 dihydroxyacetone kinase subunit L [Cyanosarcina cf. burmensis CCALA 770]PSB62990.1 dihydroxyacetone kinase subunit L [Chroococcidiopsis cubana CCALA 043]RUT06317.1 dihydroxyacetone kinase subunit DhaL [Chroococcidiopsis cubana SAG 39.79]
MNKSQVIQWLQNFATEIERNKEYLTELDAAIGDADHGINMDRGFKKVAGQLSSLADKDISTILKTVSMTLISTVGGASGPLYGTFFLRASTAVIGKEELATEDLLKLLQVGLEGVVQRGKAQLGDKTMIDVLSPVVDNFQKSVDNNQTTLVAMQQVVIVAEQAMKDTIPMLAKKGRASYLGDRSIGHQDPGATSTYLMLKSLLAALES